ncbi:MAG: hypothetical protein WBF04_19950 [Candidatus Sulfotelmatobacter sp.]
MHCIFYVFVSAVGATPLLLVWHYWHVAKTKGWSWSSIDSRNMYVDAFKTIITASGIAVALLASSAVGTVRTANPIVAFSAKVAAVCLIACVAVSLVAIVGLLRGHELAKARNIEERRAAGTLTGGEITEGKLRQGELLCILIPAAIALSCFLVGFVFLARIAFHF